MIAPSRTLALVSLGLGVASLANAVRLARAESGRDGPPTRVVTVWRQPGDVARAWHGFAERPDVPVDFRPTPDGRGTEVVLRAEDDDVLRRFKSIVETGGIVVSGR